MSDQIQAHQITAWIKHPVTQKMIEIINKHKQGNEREIHDALVYGPSLGKIDLHVISQLRGQILAFEELLKIHTYLVEAIEYEISSTGPESTAQD